MPFKKGQSGNPGGRKKTPFDIMSMCKTSAPEIMMRLIDIALGHIDGVDYGTQVKAATAVLDRGFGKPMQAVDVTTNGQDVRPVINITTGMPQPSPMAETGIGLPLRSH